MIVGNIVTPNTKGQIVIPHKMRKELGIAAGTYLQLILIGNSIVVRPIRDVMTAETENSAILKILEKTRGAWGDAKDWDQMRKRRRRIELAASRRRKQLW